MSATVIPFKEQPTGTIRVYLDLPPRFSTRGPRYNVRLASPDGEIIVTDSLTPLFDSARVLVARGFRGRLEMWDAERSYARMGGDISKLAKLTVIETETRGPELACWKPFPVQRERSKTADRHSRLPQGPKTEMAAGGLMSEPAAKQ